MRRWLSHYETLLRGAVARPDDAIVDLPMLDEDDKRTILDGWNDTAVAFPDEKRLHRLFEAQVPLADPSGSVVTAGDASRTLSSTPAPIAWPIGCGARDAGPGRLSGCWSGARISSSPCSPS